MFLMIFGTFVKPNDELDITNRFFCSVWFSYNMDNISSPNKSSTLRTFQTAIVSIIITFPPVVQSSFILSDI